MSKYQFDGSNYENWKPEEFPTGYVCPEGGTSTNCYTGGWRSNRPIWDSEKCSNACCAGLTAPIPLLRLKTAQ